MSDDFSPIADQGELERVSGIIGRLKQRRDLPPAGPGFERILTNSDGSPVAAGERLSAGEKYWAQGQGWIKVDVADHALAYELPFRDPHRGAGFTALITVTSRIIDSFAVARNGIASVKSFLEPALREAVIEACADFPSIDEHEPIVALNKMRQEAESLLRKSVRGPVRGLPDWLSATVSSISVLFDPATEKHHDDLVKRARDSELIDADAGIKKKETSNVLALRDMWRRELEPHLSNPATRAFEVVFSDPSPQNIASVVTQLNEADRQYRGEVLNVLSTLIERQYVDKDDDTFKVAFEAIVSGLEGKPFSPTDISVTGGSPAGEVEAGEVIDDPDDSQPDRNPDDS